MFTNIVEAFSVTGPISIIIYVIMVLSWWFIFEKAGKPAWYSLIPLLNFIAFVDIARKPWWYTLLLLIPLVNIVVWIDLMVSFGDAFGQDGCLYALGLALLPFIFLPLLAFGDARYQYGGFDLKKKRL